MDKRVDAALKGGDHLKSPREAQRKAASRDEHLQVLMEAVSDLIMQVAADGVILYASPASISLLGINPERLQGRTLYEFIHIADCERVRDMWRIPAEENERVICEFRMRHASGIIIWVEMRSRQVQLNGQHDAVMVLRDISVRHRQEVIGQELRQRLEEQVETRDRQLEMTVKLLRKQIEAHKRDKDALEVSERRYTTLVENILTGIYIHDGNKLIFCNELFAKIFGFDRDNMENMNTNELFADGRSIEALLADSAQEEVVEGVGRDGRPVWLKVSRARLTCSEQTLVIGSVIDITDEILVNERLKQSEQELHMLSSQLMEAQEKERKRIANELHDGLGQRLSAIKFAVENVWRATDQEIYPQQAKQLSAVIDSMRDAIEEVRRVSMDLRPSILDDLGLIATIGWFCREFAQLFPTIGVDRNITANEDDIPGMVKVVIFRIIQEAFHNITKHAEADQIELGLHMENKTLYLLIRDNGRGIASIDQSPCAKGLGLKSMRERAELTNGAFRIESASGRGTLVAVEWPGARSH